MVVNIVVGSKVSVGVKYGKHNHHNQNTHDRSKSTSGSSAEVKPVKSDHHHHRILNSGTEEVNGSPQKWTENNDLMV